MVSNRKTGGPWISRWLLILATAAVPLVASTGCDGLDFSLSFFGDGGHDFGGFSDVFIDDGFYFDDCFYGGCF